MAEGPAQGEKRPRNCLPIYYSTLPVRVAMLGGGFYRRQCRGTGPRETNIRLILGPGRDRAVAGHDKRLDSIGWAKSGGEAVKTPRSLGQASEGRLDAGEAAVLLAIAKFNYRPALPKPFCASKGPAPNGPRPQGEFIPPIRSA